MKYKTDLLLTLVILMLIVTASSVFLSTKREDRDQELKQLVCQSLDQGYTGDQVATLISVAKNPRNDEEIQAVNTLISDALTNICPKYLKGVK